MGAYDVFFSNRLIDKLCRKLFGQKYLLFKEVYLLKQTTKKSQINIIVGAGFLPDKKGWVSTNPHTLDLLNEQAWQVFFLENTVDRILAEHVWEHLTPSEGQIACNTCFKFLKPGGRLRIAVPDGYHPSAKYIEMVKPGGTGGGSDDHKILYNCKKLTALLKKSGFDVELVEYFDESGKFHYVDWSSGDGYVHRSRFDKRNRDGKLNYTSLIIDGIKPLNT